MCIGIPFHFEVPGDAVPLARARVTKAGHAYLPERSRNYRTLVQMCARSAMKKARITTPLVGALCVCIREIRKRPKRPTRNFPTSRPDIDNIAKAILDALNGLAWNDDAQVIWLDTSKIYGPEPLVEVSIFEIERTKPVS